MDNEGLDSQEPTQQQATQLLTDPRRLGQTGSRLSLEDQSDICCILVPITPSAIEAATLIHKKNPQLTLASNNNVRIRERGSGVDNSLEPLEARDLVLRLSADLKDPIGGFLFGRNPNRCDFHMGWHDASRRISNVHFRIYINEWRTLMIEDQSTNGTAVDDVVLHGKNKENAAKHTHTLESGSIITLTMTPPSDDWKWTVLIPQRDDVAELLYEQNVERFLRRAEDHKARNIVALRGPPNLFPRARPMEQNPSVHSSRGRTMREWTGGDRYNKVAKIGEGAFAAVFKVTCKYEGIPYAAKEIAKRRFMKQGKLDTKFGSELKIMQRIRHPNIVKFIEHIEWNDYLYIIMEFIPEGDLGGLMRPVKFLSVDLVKLMTEQLLGAVKYLHQEGITHRDIKPDNILILSRDPFHVKLTDFGLSKLIDSDDTFLRTFCGTLLYCAPEVYSEYREYDQTGTRAPRPVDRSKLPPQRYDSAVDIWSLAGVLYYSLCGRPPYPAVTGVTHQELLNTIMTTALDIRPLQEAHVSDDGIRFVRSMLHTRPEYRATIEELEHTPWFNNGMIGFGDDDEFDFVNDDARTTQLENETSQLSITNAPGLQAIDSQATDLGYGRFAEVRGLEIPSSFNTGDSSSNAGESLVLTNEPSRAPNGNGRLFGEVGVSAVASSGVLDSAYMLNLPIQTRDQDDLIQNGFDQFGTSLDSLDPQLRTTASPNMPPPQITTGLAQTPSKPPTPGTAQFAPGGLTQYPVNTDGTDERFMRSSSLLGAESMVGHLNMHSPVSPMSHAADSPVASTEPPEATRDPGVSLRRPREEDEDEDDGIWPPAYMPSKRQRRSQREIEMKVPASTFWDPKDKSTHHSNYPIMMLSDYHAWQERAVDGGEKFEPGNRLFEKVMRNFRSSRPLASSTTSMEAEDPYRAHSEPTKEEGRRMLVQQDEQALAGPLSKSLGAGAMLGDASLPTTAGCSAVNETRLNSTKNHAGDGSIVGDNFQRPKRVIAKLTSTPDSTLKGIVVNVTDAVTSWGRSVACTIRYPHLKETHVPKHAFKIAIFKPGYYQNGLVGHKHTWSDNDQDLKLYISTKASQGIYINNVHLPSSQHDKPSTKSHHWVELKHGDEIIVWQQCDGGEQYTKLKFECYWGMSKEPRDGQDVETVKDSEFVKELDDTCLIQEAAILKEQDVRRASVS